MVHVMQELCIKNKTWQPRMGTEQPLKCTHLYKSKTKHAPPAC